MNSSRFVFESKRREKKAFARISSCGEASIYITKAGSNNERSQHVFTAHKHTGQNGNKERKKTANIKYIAKVMFGWRMRFGYKLQLLL